VASVVKVSILGAMPGGEVWSVNPTFFLLDEPASVSATEALTIATAVDALTVPTGLRAWFNNATSITGCRVEARDRNGILEALGEHTRAAPVLGTGIASHPYQTSTVTSLRTAFPGGQGRGRLYWPATGFPITPSTLRADAAILAAGLAAVKTYLSDIEAAVAVSAGPADLAVWSRTGSAFHAVSSMRQGDVLDTQRRRRDTLTESYSELAYP
jgi:hypothetical protein